MQTSSLIKFGSSSTERDLKAYLFFFLIFSAFGNSLSDAFTTRINPASHLALTSNKQQRQQLHHQFQLRLASDSCKSESDNRQLQSSTNTSPTTITTTTTADTMHPKTIAQLLQPKNVDALQTILSRTIPPLTSSAHKGSSGRIAILGGSEKYTGAPFYAAMSALRTGVDLASIYCAQEASIAIKSYSPELMVDSVYEAREIQKIQAKKGGLDVDGDDDDDDDRKRVVNAMVDNVMESLGRMHALVIGPGLGRDPSHGRDCPNYI